MKSLFVGAMLTTAFLLVVPPASADHGANDCRPHPEIAQLCFYATGCLGSINVGGAETVIFPNNCAPPPGCFLPVLQNADLLPPENCPPQ